MDFKDLKLIMREIKATITCSDCKHYFSDEDIRVIGAVHDEGFFHAHCHECRNNTIINVMFNGSRRHRKIEHPHELKVVNKDDILDMHNFLKDFNGDFTSLFTKRA